MRDRVKFDDLLKAAEAAAAAQGTRSPRDAHIDFLKEEIAERDAALAQKDREIERLKKDCLDLRDSISGESDSVEDSVRRSFARNRKIERLTKEIERLTRDLSDAQEAALVADAEIVRLMRQPRAEIERKDALLRRVNDIEWLVSTSERPDDAEKWAAKREAVLMDINAALASRAEGGSGGATPAEGTAIVFPKLDGTWAYLDNAYPEEGEVGPFDSEAEAVAHAKLAYKRVVIHERGEEPAATPAEGGE